MTLNDDMWSGQEDETSSFSFGSRQPFETISVYGIQESEEDDQAEEPSRRLGLSDRHKRIIMIFAACALACGVMAVIFGRVAARSTVTKVPVAFETATVERKNFENVITATGKLKAGSSVVVTPEVDGTIEKVLVKEGQVVKEGEILFTIKNDSLDKAVSDAKRDIETAQQSLTTAQAAVTQAEAARDDAWKRYNDAWDTADRAHREWANLKDNYAAEHAAWESSIAAAESIKPTPDMEPGPWSDDPEWAEKNQRYQDALNAYEAALASVGEEPKPAGAEPTYPAKPDDIALQGAINKAEESVTAANLNITKAQEAYDEAVKNGEKRTVKSPAAGSVASLNVKVGEAVSGSVRKSDDSAAGTSLAQIDSVDSMGIDAEVNEIDILNVKKGQWAKATFSAVKDVEANAIVSEVASVASGTAEDGSATFHVGLVIPQPDSKLRAGMSASISLVAESVPNAIVVPAQAITEDESGASVEVVIDEEEQTTEKRLVTLGARNSAEAVVEGGLNEGEVILLHDTTSE